MNGIISNYQKKEIFKQHFYFKSKNKKYKKKKKRRDLRVSLRRCQMKKIDDVITNFNRKKADKRMKKIEKEKRVNYIEQLPRVSQLINEVEKCLCNCRIIVVFVNIMNKK